MVILLLVDLAVSIQADAIEHPIPLLSCIEHDAARRLSVAARTSGFLDEGLEAAGDAVVDDEADGGGVDAHAEGGGGDDYVECSGEALGGCEGGFGGVQEGLLDGLAEERVQAGVVGGGGYGVGA